MSGMNGSVHENLRLRVLLTWAVEFVARETDILEDCHTLGGTWDGTEPEVQAQVDDARRWLREAKEILGAR